MKKMHIDELNKKHKELEKMIAVEIARPLADSLKISELKKEKLVIKEHIDELVEQGSEEVA